MEVIMATLNDLLNDLFTEEQISQTNVPTASELFNQQQVADELVYGARDFADEMDKTAELIGTPYEEDLYAENLYNDPVELSKSAEFQAFRAGAFDLLKKAGLLREDLGTLEYARRQKNRY